MHSPLHRIAFLVVCVLLALLVPAASSQSLEEQLSKGRQAYRNGEHTVALEAFRTWLVRQAGGPDHSEVRYKMARCLDRLGQRVQATSDLQDWLAVGRPDPWQLRGWLLLGEWLGQAGGAGASPHQAEAAYTRALALAEQMPGTARLRLEALLGRGRLRATSREMASRRPQAETDLVEVIRQDFRGEQGAAARLALGDLYLGNPQVYDQAVDRAVDVWRELCRVQPASPLVPMARDRCARAFLSQHRYLEAAEDLEALVRDFPNRPEGQGAKSRLHGLRRPALEIRDPGGHRPGAPLIVGLSVRNLGPVTVEAWKVDLFEAFRKTPDLAALARNYRPSTPAAARVELLGQDPRDHSWRRQDVTLDLRESGAFVVRAQAGDTTTSGLVVVSNLVGVGLSDARGQAAVWLMDARTGRGASGVEVLHASGARGETGVFAKVDRMQAGPEGLVDLPPATRTGRHLLLARRGTDHFLMPDLRQPVSPASWQACLYTERPAYRAGDRVRWKAYVRSRARHGQAIPAGQAFLLEVRDPRGRVLHQVRPGSGNLGTLRGDFVLPRSTSAGDCRMVLQAPSRDGAPTDLAATLFLADPAPKANLELKLKSRHPWRLAGEKAQLDLEVRDDQSCPVAGVLVDWSVTGRPLVGDDGPPPGGERVASAAPSPRPATTAFTRLSGRVRTDQDGRAVLSFPVSAPPAGEPAENLLVRVRTLDAEGHRADDAVELPVGRTATVLQASLEGPAVPDVTQGLTVRAQDLLGRPARATVQVSVIENGTARALGSLEPDEAGQGRLAWTPRGPGPWSLELRAGGTTASLAVPVGRSAGSGLAIGLDRASYRPGQVARLQIRTPRPGSEALVLVEGEEILGRMVVFCPTPETRLDLPVTAEMSPRFRLRVLVGTQEGVQQQDVEVPAPDPARLLQVRVRPQAQPVPGRSGRLLVQTWDHQGQAVEAEVSLALVGPDPSDPPLTPSLVGAFFGARGFRATAVGGRLVDPPPVAARSTVTAAEAAHSRFLETAFWSPDLRTGPEGQAEVALTWPQTAGRWVLVARAVAGGVRVGEAVTALDLQRELEVRLEGPRRLIEGDAATYRVVLENRGQKAVSAGFRGQARGLRVEDPQKLELGVPAQGERAHSLEVVAASAGSAELEVLAQGPAGLEKASRTVPVDPRAPRQEQVQAGGVAGSAKAVLPAPAVGSTGRRLDIALSPGLAGLLIPATGALAVGPASNEGLIHRLAPATLVLRSLRDMKLPYQDLEDRLTGITDQTLALLRQSQRADGGWGWWSESPTEARVTAEVCRGLLLVKAAREAGADPAVQRACDDLVSSACGFLVARLAVLEPDDRASALQALALARRSPTRALLALARQPEGLSAAGRLHLVSALHAQGFSDVARQILRADRKVVRHDAAASLAWWPAGGGWTEVEATAIALEVHLDLEPESPLNTPAAHWLCSRRGLRGWATARETAMATSALARYLGRVGEKPSAFGYGIWLNGNEVETGRFEPADWAKSRVVTLRGVQLPEGPLTVEIRKAGPGQAWWCAVQSVAGGAGPGSLKVQRSHFRLQASGRRVPLKDEMTVQPGERIETVLQVEAPRPLRHVTLEAPLAAGLEAPFPAPSHPGAHVETREGAVRFSLARVPKGRLRLTWTSQARWPGRYHVPPARLQEVDDPESGGSSAPGQLVIGRKSR